MHSRSTHGAVAAVDGRAIASLCHAGDWGSVADVDAAVAVEVIEHLDLPQVEALGGSMLGALRPGTAIVTTPNWEYNVVLQSIPSSAASVTTLAAAAMQAAPGDAPPIISLRNKDHRFEWWAFSPRQRQIVQPGLSFRQEFYRSGGVENVVKRIVWCCRFPSSLECPERRQTAPPTTVNANGHGWCHKRMPLVCMRHLIAISATVCTCAGHVNNSRHGHQLPQSSLATRLPFTVLVESQRRHWRTLLCIFSTWSPR